MSAELIEREYTDLEDYQFLGNRVTVDNKLVFITALRDTSTVYHAAQQARISRKTAYQWRDNDPQFAEAWDEALEDSVDVMETSVYKRALGPPDPDGHYRGGDSLLKMFWLKAHRHKFRDKVTIDIPAVQNEIRERLASMPMVASGNDPLNTAQFPLAPRLLQKDNNDPDSNES